LRARGTRGQPAKYHAIKGQVALCVWFPAAEDSKTKPPKEALDINKTNFLEPAKLNSKGGASIVSHPRDCVLNLSLGTPKDA
jgi:hypothetical protein